MLASAPFQSTPGLVDRNKNGISDGLEERLNGLENGQGLRSDQRFRVIVTFKSKDANAVAIARAAIGEFPVRREFRLISGFAADLTEAQIRALAAHPDVYRVTEDFDVYGQLDSARQDFGSDVARTNYSVSGAGIGVCVLDSGIDAAHEQFNNKTIKFFDAVNGQEEPYDDHGHGTHVSSILAGAGTGSALAALYRGVAPEVDLYIGKVLNADAQGPASEIMAGMDWCASQPGVRIISMSLSISMFTDGLDELSNHANAAANAGIVVVVAAGNEGPALLTIGTPGAAEKAMTVGACAEWSPPATAGAESAGIYVAPFSSRGPILDRNPAQDPNFKLRYIKPDVCGPGHSIAAAQVGTESGYVADSGTSMAAPYVSGAIALPYKQIRP
jgi:serine protease AprX